MTPKPELEPILYQILQNQGVIMLALKDTPRNLGRLLENMMQEDFNHCIEATGKLIKKIKPKRTKADK